jgi:putative addiction module component (TIGR02574 family)
MPTLSKKLLEEVLHLPLELRAALAGSLIESLENADIARGAETAWRSEIARRMKDLDSGQVRPVPWPEARRRILAKSK